MATARSPSAARRTYRAEAPTAVTAAAAAMFDLDARLGLLPAGVLAEEVQAEVYAVGKEHGFEPLRDWFKALYEILFGQDQGPRFGSFAALYGVTNTAKLIRDGLAGKFMA